MERFNLKLHGSIACAATLHHDLVSRTRSSILGKILTSLIRCKFCSNMHGGIFPRQAEVWTVVSTSRILFGVDVGEPRYSDCCITIVFEIHLGAHVGTFDYRIARPSGGIPL